MFVFRDGKSDDTGLPWELLRESGNLAAFRRDFAFKEIELRGFYRFKVDMEVSTLRRWLDIRSELK